MGGYRTVAVGGTFDCIHRGHRLLLSKAFESGERVLIGVTSDRFARHLGKTPAHGFERRVEGLREFLGGQHPGRTYTLQPLEDYFGPLFFSDEVEAIVVSEETLSRVELANRLRAGRGLKPVDAIVIGTVFAEDGLPLSTTRIRRGEIDAEGRAARK